MKKFLIKVGISLLFIGLGIYLLLKSSIFTIKKIEVVGNQDVDKDLIIQVSEINLKRDSLFLDKKILENRIEMIPRVEKVHVKRILPSTISLNITERQALVLVPLSNINLILDKYGYILDASEGMDSGLIILNGIKGIKSVYLGHNIKEYMDEETNKLLDPLFNGENIEKFRSVNLEKDRADMFLYNDIRVAFGGYDNSDYKLKVLDVTLESIQEGKNGKVEMILMDEGPDAIVVYQ